MVITSGLLKQLEGKGIEQIADLHVSGNVLRVNEYWGSSGAGAGAHLGKSGDVLVPEILFQTNDAWPIVRGTANGRGAPLLLMDHNSKGILYVLTIPENANDLYALPQPVLTSIKQYLMSGFSVWMDAPAKVSLFAYDNHSFVVESFLDTSSTAIVSIPGNSTHLRNLTTGETIEGKPAPQGPLRHAPQRAEFKVEVPSHGFVALAEE